MVGFKPFQTDEHLTYTSTAAVTQSIPMVTSYATLGVEGLTTSLRQTGAKAIFVDPELLSKLTSPLDVAPDVKFIILNDQHPVIQSDVGKLKAKHPRLTDRKSVV